MDYTDIWRLHKWLDDFDQTLQGIYEEQAQTDLGEEALVTPQHRSVIRGQLETFGVELNSFNAKLDEADTGAMKADMDDLISEMVKSPFPANPLPPGERAFKYQKDESDDCVRIVLRIPAPHLSAEERVRLERDLVQEAASFTNTWMQVRDAREESRDMNEEPEEDEAIEVDEDEVPVDMAERFMETYEALRGDDGSEKELITSVLESLIEDGIIEPGPSYRVRSVDQETLTIEFMNGDKMELQTREDEK